jgi:hypothetical protein
MDYVKGHVLSLGACLGSSRKSGGSKGLSLWSREEFLTLHSDREEFTKLVYRDSERRPEEKPIVEFKLVNGGGKCRGITMNEGNHQVLGPLHRMMYDTISDERWLLRGDAHSGRFKNFLKEEGCMFVSGDYTSATDNLTIEVAELILRNSMTYLGIPDHVKQFAMRSLRVDIRDTKGNIWSHKRGQLMGSLLSFPLLCLQNYIAFRYYVSREEVSDDNVRINGDDIIFKCRSVSVYERWRDGIVSLGLELSSGKTFLDRSFFSLNSTYFWACEREVKSLPVARLGVLMRCRDGDVGENMNEFLRPFSAPVTQKGNGKKDRNGLCLRSRSLSCYWKFHEKLIKALDCSITRCKPFGLEAKILSGELKVLGLLDRERSWFLRYPISIPTIESPNNFDVPKDYRLVECDGVDEGGKSEDLFVTWHWQTSIKLKDSKTINARYINECDRLLKREVVYIEAEDRWTWNPATWVAPSLKSRLEVGRHHLGRGQYDVVCGREGNELARVDELIDKDFYERFNRNSRKVRKIVRRNRFGYWFDYFSQSRRFEDELFVDDPAGVLDEMYEDCLRGYIHDEFAGLFVPSSEGTKNFESFSAQVNPGLNDTEEASSKFEELQQN